MMSKPLQERLRIKAGVMSMGEPIAFGSDTELMYEAADKLDRLEEAKTLAVNDAVTILNESITRLKAENQKLRQALGYIANLEITESYASDDLGVAVGYAQEALEQSDE